MATRPLLVFPTPSLAERQMKGGGGKQFHLPSRERQFSRLSPKFEQLERAFEARRMDLQGTPAGTVPEQVLVLETIGTIPEFYKAIARIPGLEWLAEKEEEDIPPDEDFYEDEEHRERGLRGTIFLVMTNQQAMAQLLSLWKRYNEGAALGYGYAKWKSLFEQLREIRPWDVEDRLKETGAIEDWNARVQANEQSIRFEAELWFRKSELERQRSHESFEDLLVMQGGGIISQAVIPEIAYHGILAEVPAGGIQAILAGEQTLWVKSDHVMFFRPTGQIVERAPQEDAVAASPHSGAGAPSGDPVVALLDGLPLENHSYLAGRLIVDDPDGWSMDYPVQKRSHGTAMASLLVHGELDSPELPLSRPVYVRPILKPDQRPWISGDNETVPEDTLTVDLVYRALRRIFEGEGDQAPVAPSVRVVNISVGDRSHLFDRILSPWARLLDWWAWRRKILFVVSTGNHPRSIELAIERASLQSLTPEQLQIEVLKAIAGDARNRRLLAPSEGINMLTVGAGHTDSSLIGSVGFRKNVFLLSTLPSPINSLGLGFRRAVKPDVLIAGGRQLYTERMGTTHTNAILDVSTSVSPPGQKVAAPSKTPGVLTGTVYACGTSNAAALGSRACAQIYDLLLSLRQEPGGEALTEEFVAVLLKSLVVHGASWGDSFSLLEQALKNDSNSLKFREYVTRFLGYGMVDSNRARYCTDQRVTILGCGALADDEAHLYSVPLPPSLSGKKLMRRVVITLAWLTPLNPFRPGYRGAQLWTTPSLDVLQVKRIGADPKAVQRGTVQHEIFEGEEAAAFTDGSMLEVKVNCREDAGEAITDIPYGLAVTLEVAGSIDLPIYEEIRARIRPEILIAPPSG